MDQKGKKTQANMYRNHTNYNKATSEQIFLDEE
jgi:hypothetical protein